MIPEKLILPPTPKSPVVHPKRAGLSHVSSCSCHNSSPHRLRQTQPRGSGTGLSSKIGPSQREPVLSSHLPCQACEACGELGTGPRPGAEEQPGKQREKALWGWEGAGRGTGN